MVVEAARGKASWSQPDQGIQGKACGTTAALQPAALSTLMISFATGTSKSMLPQNQSFWYTFVQHINPNQSWASPISLCQHLHVHCRCISVCMRICMHARHHYNVMLVLWRFCRTAYLTTPQLHVREMLANGTRMATCSYSPRFLPVPGQMRPDQGAPCGSWWAAANTQSSGRW